MNSEPLSQEYLDQIRRRSEEATSAPWIDFLEDRDQFSGDSFIGRGPDRSEDDLYQSSVALMQISYLLLMLARIFQDCSMKSSD